MTYRSALPQVQHILVNLRHFEEEHIQSDPVILEYDWVLGPWSQCSQTCGDEGVQVSFINSFFRQAILMPNYLYQEFK